MASQGSTDSDNFLSPLSFPIKSKYLKAVTKTWARDSHGLFDYEANNTKNITLLIHGKSKLVRKKNDVKNMLDNSELELEDRELCRINYCESKFH
jgi:hypothetical protein